MYVGVEMVGGSMGEVATTSQTSVATGGKVANVQVQKCVGRLVVEWFENSVDMVFDGDVKGKQLDIAIRLIPRRYKLWRNTQLIQLKQKEK